MLKYASVAAFLATILAANYVTTEYGMVPLGFGLSATAGTLLIGLSFILRDVLQDAAGKAVTVAVIAAGAGLSFLIAAPFIALASASAFLLSELADLLIYTPLRNAGQHVRAVALSNTVGAVVDSVVFLTVAGFPVWASMPGQVYGKLLVTAAVVVPWVLFRAQRRVLLAA